MQGKKELSMSNLFRLNGQKTEKILRFLIRRIIIKKKIRRKKLKLSDFSVVSVV